MEEKGPDPSQLASCYSHTCYLQLSLIQHPLSTRDVIGCVLDGLNLDYDVVINTVQTMSNPPSFEDLYSMLLNREKRLEIYHQLNADHETTSFFTSNNRGQGRSSTHGRGNGRNHYSNSNYHNNRGHGRGSYKSRGNGRGSSSTSHQFSNSNSNHTVVCQLCDKVGHSATQCRKFQSSIQQDDDLVGVPSS